MAGHGQARAVASREALVEEELQLLARAEELERQLQETHDRLEEVSKREGVSAEKGEAPAKKDELLARAGTAQEASVEEKAQRVAKADMERQLQERRARLKEQGKRKEEERATPVHAASTDGRLGVAKRPLRTESTLRAGDKVSLRLILAGAALAVLVALLIAQLQVAVSTRQALAAKEEQLSHWQNRAAGLERLLQDLRGTMTEHEERKGEELIKASEEGDLKVVRLLVEDGTDVNAEDKEGSTPLMGAARGGHLDTFWLLLEHGADVNAKNKHGSTPLMYAALNGHLDVARHLIENGADVNAKNKNGWTPLIRAAYWGQLSVVRHLVENGADVHATEKGGKTALDLARLYGHPEIVRFLEPLSTVR